MSEPALPPPPRKLKITILGLSITSSWGNGHATTYRGLVRALAARGHEVVFLERDMPWYASNRDLPQPPWGRTHLYASLAELRDRHAGELRDSDLVLVGSYVPEGVQVGQWARQTAPGPCGFYDIDTPVTLAKLERGDFEYLAPELIPGYDIYLSFTGGPLLEHLERKLGSPCARPLYCSVDPDLYYPAPAAIQWDMGYLGTYSDDRQPTLDRLLVEPARRWRQGRFVLAGPQYPAAIDWPPNLRRIEHLPPARHREFYCAQRVTLNVTRQDMVRAGYSPSVRLFEAAACGRCILSDAWDGLNCFFEPGREILVARTTEEALDCLRSISDEELGDIGRRARRRVLAAHTAQHRAWELEQHALDLLEGQKRPQGEVSTGSCS